MIFFLVFLFYFDIYSELKWHLLDWIKIELKYHINYANIGSGNELVPDSTNPLPEPMLIKIYVTMYSVSRPLWVKKKIISWYTKIIWITVHFWMISIWSHRIFFLAAVYLSINCS